MTLPPHATAPRLAPRRGPGHGALFLTGMMGSGKSAVGRCLAELLRVPLLDLDAILEARCGAPIADLLPRWMAEQGAVAGEAHFRRLERDVLQEIAAAASRDRSVVSTGGGIVLDPANRATMRHYGHVVYLEVPVAILVQRLSQPDQRAARPLLANDSDLASRVTALLAARQDAYLACDTRVDGNQMPDAVATAIVTWLNRAGHGPTSL